MILGRLKDFEWYNEPEDFSFDDGGLCITAGKFTDFWQNSDCNFSKDDGHFFNLEKDGDFVLDCKWVYSKIVDSAQCGAMVRINQQNWLKVGLLSTNIYNPQIGVVCAVNGSSDWSLVDISDENKELYFRIRRCGPNFVVYYSVDGQKYKIIRIIHLSAAKFHLRAGAYACSPKGETFDCILKEINVKNL